MKDILLFGAGLHSLTCIDAIEQQQECRIIGIIDSKREIGSSYDGYEILGRQENVVAIAEKYAVKSGFVAIGDNWARKCVSEEVLKLIPDFDFVNVIHPTAVFGKEIKLGRGIFIGAQSFISSYSKIGNSCLIHQKTLLGLHNLMEDFSSVSVGSIVGGKVTIRECSALTLGVIVHSRLEIGPNTVVGSGAIVTKSLPSMSVCLGQPARVVRSRKEGEPYFKSE